jgi:tetratricopeptide (TPR) repeat protein
MRLPAVIAAFLLCAALHVNAGVLKGVVRENELGGPVAANVAVSAPGANPTKTDQYGEFTLSFPSKKSGGTVLISITKPDYVVVNDIQLEQVLPADPDAKLLVILICPPGRREEMARRFYHLKSGEEIEARYQKRLNESQAASAEQTTLLQKERDKALAQSEIMSEQLALAKPGQMSEIFNQALRLFVDGRTEEALRVLNEGQLQQSLVAARKRKEEAEKAIEQAAQSWVLRARLFILQFKFEDASQAYQQAVQAAPDSFEVNLSFASFSHSLNRYAAAKKGYERCLALARQRGNAPDIAGMLNRLGNLHSEQNRMDEARLAYDEALKIYRQVAKDTPDTYLPKLAMTLNNLGTLHSAQNRPDEANLAYKEALKIFRELAQDNPDTYLPKLAMTLNNLGLLRQSENRTDEARLAYDEALKIYRQLAKDTPDTYLPTVATTLNNLGNLYVAQNYQLDEARLDFEESLQIRRDLALTNPETYLPAVANVLNNLGLLNRAQDRLDEAHSNFSEALKIYRELAQTNPETYRPYLAGTLNNLGDLFVVQNYLDEANLALEESLKIRRELAQRNPETYLPNLAKTLNNLGKLRHAQNRPAQARLAFEEALGIYQRFAARNPDQFGKDVKRTRALIEELPTAN